MFYSLRRRHSMLNGKLTINQRKLCELEWDSDDNIFPAGGFDGRDGVEVLGAASVQELSKV